MKKRVVFLFLLLNKVCFSQSDSSKAFTFSGYTEFYYSYDFSKPQNHLKPDFIYNYKRHNEISLHLAYAKASYNKNNVRANLAFMAGSYAEFNLSAEPTWAQYVYEANVGVKLSSKQNIWLDAGIMPSHIGFESAVGADCWNLTRSMQADNSPYYEAGIKLSYTNKKENLNAAFLILNGWQRIQRPDYIQRPSFGFQFNYKPTNNLTINYNNFIGSDKPDSLHAWRFFNNVSAVYELGKIAFTIGIDIGTDKYNEKDYGVWFSPILITRFTLSPKFKIALRAEYYNDEKQIIIITNTPNGFKTFGTSLNLDFLLNKLLLWRMEGKYYRSSDNIFTNAKNTLTNNNVSFTTSLAIKF